MTRADMIRVGIAVGALACGGAVAGIAGAAAAPSSTTTGQSTTTTSSTPTTTTPRTQMPHHGSTGNPCPHMGIHPGSGSSSKSGQGPSSGSVYEGGPPPGVSYQ